MPRAATAPPSLWSRKPGALLLLLLVCIACTCGYVAVGGLKLCQGAGSTPLRVAGGCSVSTADFVYATSTNTQRHVLVKASRGHRQARRRRHVPVLFGCLLAPLCPPAPCSSPAPCPTRSTGPSRRAPGLWS